MIEDYYLRSKGGPWKNLTEYDKDKKWLTFDLRRSEFEEEEEEDLTARVLSGLPDHLVNDPDVEPTYDPHLSEEEYHRARMDGMFFLLVFELYYQKEFAKRTFEEHFSWVNE